MSDTHLLYKPAVTDVDDFTKVCEMLATTSTVDEKGKACYFRTLQDAKPKHLERRHKRMYGIVKSVFGKYYEGKDLNRRTNFARSAYSVLKNYRDVIGDEEKYKSCGKTELASEVRQHKLKGSENNQSLMIKHLEKASQYYDAWLAEDSTNTIGDAFTWNNYSITSDLLKENK